MVTGAGRQLGAQHSHSLEGWFAHVPGLKVIAPATVEDARWMLATALKDPDPVIIFEHASLYGTSGEVPSDSGPVDIDTARVRRSGDDVSIITHGGSLHKAMTAAEELATVGISAEVLDLRSLRPLDSGAILKTVSHTHRLVIVDEGWKSVGLSAEVLARVVEGAMWELDAPIERVCAVEVPIPYARHMEEAALPQVTGIVAAVHEVLGR
jgi:pyruvate dehydrogenase E1 component beta subunit